MLELPEALTISRQLREKTVGKKIEGVLPPTKPHKFCWFSGKPENYEEQLIGSRITDCEGFGIYAEISFSNDKKLCFNDGVNVRFTTETKPKDYQLLICFDDGSALVFTVAMYGSIMLHDGSFNDKYYLKSKNYTEPFSGRFEEYFYKRLDESKPNMSAKAFLATEQRFPGIGNGVSQDILFAAGINPKRKLTTIGDSEKNGLYKAVLEVLEEMISLGGRNTEKDIFGNPGGYTVKMCKNSLKDGCPKCGGEITKETFLGGSVYYCPKCQPLE